jgi:catechol 2,3-dioxygenase-like lactoylglutathione lyase family enzyme
VSHVTAGPPGSRVDRGTSMSHTTHPMFRQVVLDTTDARSLAEFYRELLGLAYRPGDEPPPQGQADDRGEDWLVLEDRRGVGIAFQHVDRLAASTWPSDDVPQQLHLDLTVPDEDELDAQHARALDLGATLVLDRSDDPTEQLRVYADPAGHPFCIFVATS